MRFSELEGRLDTIIQNVAQWNKTMENKDRHWGYSEKGLTGIQSETQKEKRKSPGQPMRTHTLTSRNLPLIYINTSVIRIFVPKTEEMQPSIEGILFRIFFSSLILNTVCVSDSADY